jgi:hypothetical protein
MSELTQLERDVLSAAAHHDPERPILEEQIASAVVLTREHTGVGFYTNLSVPESLPKLRESRWQIEEMPRGFADHPALPAGASFILWIKAGRLVCLEGYTNHGDWPADETAFRVAV